MGSASSEFEVRHEMSSRLSLTLAQRGQMLGLDPTAWSGTVAN